MRTCAVVVLLLTISCGPPTTPCGSFTFTGAPNGNRGENVSVNFAFGPSACSASCNCNTIAYIQIVRITNRDDGQFLSPNTDQTNRMVTGRTDATLNGWAVDRISNRKWGYYARFDDGTFDTYLTTGSNTTAAILGDSPGGWPDNS